MKVAVLGAKLSPCAEPMDQTVVPATGLPSPSVQVKAVPPHSWTSIPRCRLYQACSAGASLALKTMPPMPVTRFIEPPRSGAARHRVNLVQASAAEFRLGSVDIGMVPLRVDERFHCVLRSSAGEEFAISAPPSRMARHPDVNREASEHSEAALEVGLLLWI